jgi:hypothetical protein
MLRGYIPPLLQAHFAQRMRGQICGANPAPHTVVTLARFGIAGVSLIYSAILLSVNGTEAGVSQFGAIRVGAGVFRFIRHDLSLRSLSTQ